MEEAMVGAAVGATIKVLIQNLMSISMKEIKLIRGFNKELEKLRSTLVTINEFVNGAETLQVADISVKQWLKKLEDVAFEADNVLDEVHYLSLSKDSRNPAIEKKLISIFSSFNPLKFGRKIRDINQEFELINREASVLGLPTRLAGLHATGVAPNASASVETDSFTFNPVFLGRDDDVKEVVERLTNISTDEVFSVLPIVGMGGMGKSTLAREVIKVQTRFVTHIWVHVSANFDPVVLFKKVLMVLTSDKVKVENREVLLKKLGEALSNKTYLLILDDVWNEDRLKWESFINSLLGVTSTKGNGIILTTRNRGVATIVATLPIYVLKGLSDDVCWSIIKVKAFGRDIPSEFENLGRNITKKCQGLPLAANIVGGVLRGKSKDEWVSIQENWLSDHVEGNFIRKVLKLSFDNLSSPSLKKCFAYCSIFPKGSFYLREKLIKLWMAEGFLQADERCDMETVGNKFFNFLLQSSLLQYWERLYFGENSLCIMHDLVHDVAMEVNNNISDSINRTRYIGRLFTRDDSSPVPKQKAKYMRTLFFKGEISGAMFSYFKSLHVLSLMSDDAKEVPSSIGELIHLRYLSISFRRIEYLPKAIGELYHLQTFDVCCSGLKKLPSTLKYLIGLRHLYASDRTKLPGELGKLTSLQTIPYFKVGHKKGHRIAELRSLKNLKGKLKIYNLERVKDEEEAKSACIFENPNIVELELHWNESKEGETNYENVLEGLKPHPNLKTLHIFGFEGTRFPSWMKGLNNLMEIKLSNCSECEEIPMMGHLPSLKSLYLDNMRNVKCLGSSFYGIDHCISNNGVYEDAILVFPALERLVLEYMPNMKEWVEVELPGASNHQPREVKVFPRLTQLEINCKELTSVPSHFPCLEVLRLSGLRSGDVHGFKITSLTQLTIWGLQELECLPHGLFYNNPHLSTLDISFCPKLRELPNGLHTLSSLQGLLILSCQSLELIPYSSTGQSFTSLRCLIIHDCEELMTLPLEMVESCVPSLEKLQLGRLRRLTNMQMIIDCLQKMPHLKKVDITYMPKFTITSPTETLSFRSLESLCMGPGSESWDCVSFKEVVDVMLRLRSHSIRELHLIGVEQWESLPDQLQHLSALENLILSHFGIQEFPEWFRNLSSLQILCFCNCERLRSLPTVEAMRRLTNLTDLYISDCPLLNERDVKRALKRSGQDRLLHFGASCHF